MSGSTRRSFLRLPLAGVSSWFHDTSGFTIIPRRQLSSNSSLFSFRSRTASLAIHVVVVHLKNQLLRALMLLLYASLWVGFTSCYPVHSIFCFGRFAPAPVEPFISTVGHGFVPWGLGYGSHAFLKCLTWSLTFICSICNSSTTRVHSSVACLISSLLMLLL